MNKLYFAKWLPIEGEIKGGDYLLYNKKTIWQAESGIIAKGAPDDKEDGIRVAGTNNYLFAKAAQKVKLFLCSRDIQIGDKLTGWSNKTHYTAIKEDIELFKKSGVDSQIFKVVGEISPDALSYVKEGDEFDKEQLRLRFTNMHYELLSGSYDFEPEKCNESFMRIAIKGPCGHFH
jgi:hypothetical protein